MKYAVIYARYSSDRQNEMSIEGQIEKCRSYADEHDMVIVQEYIDRAQTATTDKRPEFLRMISDSENRTFDTILVYQLDRFARNKDDSGYYKKILRENGVKVVSAMEQIASDSSGVITEGMLEIVADWYSKQLSEKVTRGMRQRAEQVKYNGGGKTFGYLIDENGYYIVDPVNGPIVQEIFERTSEGEAGTSILKNLSERGIKNQNGKPLTKNSLYRILRCEKYKGIYVYDDIRIIDGIPRIVSDELFDSVQMIADARAYKSGHRPAIDDYLLTGKLFCGHCKNQMTGTSGTSKSGKTHRYYQCKAAPRKCDKKNVQKENIENIVFKRCQERITDELIDEIVANIIKVNESDQDSIELVRIRKEIRELENKIEKLLDQMEAGAGSDLVIGRLKKRGEELEQLKKRHSLEKNKQITIDPEVVRKFLKAIRKGNIKDLQYKKMLVKVLIDKVYLYDDHVTVILQNNGSKKTDSENSIDVIEDYFSGECSGMNLTGAPLEKRWESHLFSNLPKGLGPTWVGRPNPAIGEPKVKAEQR